MQFVLLIFALLTIVGSWTAWRRSPLYSLKTTLKMVGAFLAIVAVTVGLVWAIVSGPFSHSPVMQAVLGIFAILALATGASITIIRITDSHVAQLPPSVRLVTLHRHKIAVWIWRFLVYLLVMTAASLAVPASWFWLPSMLGGFPLLVCGPMLAILYMMARRNDRGMTSVIANPWAHWQYTPEQWQAWVTNQLEWERTSTKELTAKGMVLLVLVCAGLFGLGALFTGGGPKENLIIVGGLTGFVTLMMVIAYWFQKTNPGRRHRRLLAASPEAYFGDEGLFCNGEYSPWTLSGKYLIEADAISDQKSPPERLVFVFQSFNGSSSVRIVWRVPVPVERRTDVAVLQEKLDAHCATATVRFVLP
jgi:protein-S-isoprenylcysteine O-methyltransferase Ste14